MKKRFLSMAIVAMMVTSLLGGCGNATSNETGSSESSTITTDEASTTTDTAAEELDTSKEVNLVMYIVGDRPVGQDVNDENFNTIIKEKLNCTLTLNWIPWSDFGNKYPLLFSSGEQFDMAYTAGWLNFTSLAQKGAFMSLDELWPTYAPLNYAATSEAAKLQATVNGQIYAIPTLLATYSAYGPIYRTDIMEGTDWNGKMETFEDIEAYCDIIKATHPELEPLDIYSAGSEWDDTYMWSVGYLSSKGASNDFLFFDPTQEDPKLVTYYQCDETATFLEMMSRWNEKGFFTKSALSDTDSTKIQNGKAAIRTHNVDNLANFATIRPEYKLEYTNFVKYVKHLPYTQDAMVISNTSENPERALALWDLITNDQEVFDAFYYGILGTTYEVNEEGQYTMLDSNKYLVTNMWAARTPDLNRNIVGTPESYNTWKQTFEDSIAADDIAEKYASFVLDTASIETEYAACLSVHQQYWWPLELGYTDAVTGLAEYQEKMEAAGIEKVMEELQKQLDTYVTGLQ